jgi:nucleosome assembly protein 1-like 1
VYGDLHKLTAVTDTKQTRIVKRTVPTDSFFNFFNPPKPPADFDEDDEESADIEERLEFDYQFGEEIKEKLIPRAIDWFTGEARQYEGLGDDFDEELDEEDFDEDSDEDRDDDDDDEESDEEVRAHPILSHVTPTDFIQG